ncbi:DUF1178 family protein [Methylorubrum populi]|uniref:DUF1178 family protein n=2 Tax=Methylorubrum TaxID=2282523 RepID=A0A833J870_9HYPH|nr:MULTISPECIES: DUF1178 family protein [Methylorubrum]KAB7785271.1 hypothetical protein F8B43_3304 [Methylorubrum populi]MBA8913107.1 hypothetical protein [Methylorubrum thiocyanatum]GJE83718.1 hypothetical protein CJNNKLLH_5096 [Methylorubrum thiocyanatum]
MIRFTLACESGHHFESWFPSNAAYDEQSARGFVTCPFCDSAKVAKAPMAPAVARTDRGRPAASSPSLPVPAAPAETPASMIAEPERQLRALLRAVRAQVEASAEHVGERFADEARAIHYGDAEGRPIYGEASPQEARALIEEGIEVLPLPPAPDDRH